jgi:hypothetical protein
MSLNIGDRFTVSAPHEIKNAKGRLLARYSPDHDYRVTDRNVGDVNKMLADGVAVAGGNALAREANRLASKPGRVRAKISNKKLNKEK